MNRLRFIPYLFLPLLLSACTEKSAEKAQNPALQDTSFAKLPAPKPGEAVATFAGGCFWSFEECFKELKGVREVVSGYAGGEVVNPTYEEVSTDQTGHAESVQVYYDPNVIPYDTLAKAFLYAHDPTTLNRQGPDRGRHYRSVAFYRTPTEKMAIERGIVHYKASNPQITSSVVTEVVPFAAFYPAEVYHQGYYRAHPQNLYILTVSDAKVEKFQDKMDGKLKPDAD